ncbi:RNA-directed DNA polymerase from mobile element jockey-like 1 [Homarus americanus]|uniref:RNA-directed DNA polymerase from mobile element jockey-like 1 n=1 Tax=Homarus americanus TaxID=6706 RepID=A0A8J5MZV4_HOMAM|nr:RNA-directed DNA polymerase from mobile element jockey-like 1 [Homarus americanus]
MNRLRKEDDFSDMANMSRAIHPVAEPPTVAIPTVMKYKIPKETEFDHAYEVVVALELGYKNIKFSVKPNLVGDLILSPQDHNTAKILSEVSNLNGKAIKIIPLDPEEKTTRMVLLRYPLELPVEVVTKHSKVTKAERCVTSRDKAQTRQVLVDIKGTVPEEVDLGNWGTYKLRPFVPEPLRCYKCQKFGHHQSRCHKNKHKDGTITTAKCPNCGKKHHAWSTSCPERRERMKVAMAKVQNRTEAPQSTFVWGQQRQNKVNPTPTPPQLLQDKIEDTGTKSVHAENHDKPVDSSTAAPELCSSKRTEHSSIGGEHHIAWDTATPSGDHPTEYTPACQSTSGIHRRTNKTDDHYYDSDFLYDNTETRYQHRKYNKRSYDTAHRKDAGRPDPQNSTTTSETDDALETDIRLEEELAIQEITENRETSSPLQQITRNRTTNTDHKSDSTLKREDNTPEIPPPAPPSEQVPKKQPPLLTDEEENDSTMNAGSNYSTIDEETMTIAPPPCNLKITQWNIQGLSNKRHTVQAAASAKNIDVFILQETLMSKDQQFRLPGYQQYSVPKGPNSHGSMILVRATIPSSEVEPVHCGDGVEAQAIRIHLANDSLVVYNIYKPPTKRLEAGELLTQATQELMHIAGDFNAHHPTINSTTRMNLDGRHLVELLTDVPEITLINTGEPTHILGGTLDLAFISTELVPVAQWEVDDELTSDHFATTTTLRMELLPPPPPERLTACFATKLITRAREGDIKNGLLRALNLNRDVFNKKTWLLCAADAVNRLKLKDTILSKGPDTMSQDYSTPAPWEFPPAVFNILQTGTRKADYSLLTCADEMQLRQQLSTDESRSTATTLPPPRHAIHPSPNTEKHVTDTSPNQDAIFGKDVLVTERGMYVRFMPSFAASTAIARDIYNRFVSSSVEVQKAILPEYIHYYMTAMSWLRIINLKRNNGDTRTQREDELFSAARHVSFCIPAPMYLYIRGIGNFITGTRKHLYPEFPPLPEDLANQTHGGYYSPFTVDTHNLFEEIPCLGVHAEAIKQAFSNADPGPYSSSLQTDALAPTQNLLGFSDPKLSSLAEQQELLPNTSLKPS